MNKLHHAITAVLFLGVGLLGADRLRHSGPDRELVKQIEELRKAQHSAARDNGKTVEIHEQYAVPATKAWVDQELADKRLPEKNETYAAADKPKNPPPKMEDVQAGLDREFFAAPRDRNWGADAETTVRNALRRTISEGSQIESVQCNGALCRIETTHTDTSDYQKFIETSLGGIDSGLWNGAAFSSIVRNEHGELTVVSFLAREGTSLPEIPRM